MSEFTSIWFEEAKKLEVGQALFFRVADKKEQISLANEFEKERDDFASLNPVHSSQIFVIKTLKDMKQYVVVERKYRTPFTAFFKDSNGKFSKKSVDPERIRMLKLMVKDKKTREEMEEVLNGLTDEEVLAYFPEK
jgi:hypothetical protein